MKDLKDCYKMLEFKDFGDDRGNLIVIEGGGFDVPFNIARVFYMYGSDKDVIRGQHANKETQFIIINISGTSKVRIDNGVETTIVELNNPGTGVYLDKMVWKDMYDFSSDSVLLVLASQHYDNSEYIRDYALYKAEVFKDE